jgi:hypothetical protein
MTLIKLYKSLLIIISLLAFNSGLATTIVVIVAPDAIVIGADSKGSFIDQFSMKESKRQVCKIYQCGNYYYVVAGFTNNPVTKLDIGDIIGTYLKNENPISNQNLVNLKNEIKTSLINEINYQKSTDSSLILRTLGSDNGLVSFGILGIKESKPFGHFFSFTYSPEDILIKEDFCPGNCPNDTKVFWLGESKAIEKYTSNQENTNKTFNRIELVKHLIKLEIQDKPETVGEPIDILVISKENTYWVQKKECCPIIFF